nr:hypothetical protein [Tanacetum cinerariifolium]
MFDCDELISSELDVSVPTSLVHDRYKLGKGYHAVPPPYTGTFMTSKPDLVFNDALTVSETVPNVLNVEPSTTKPTKIMSQLNRLSAPIIEDWVSDSEDESEGEPMPTQKEPSFVQTSEHVKTPKTSVKLAEHPIHAENLSKDIPKSRGVIDSGCSRHMNGNIFYLSEFEDINGGCVAFGGNPKGGKITSKDTECVVLSSDFKLPSENHMLLRVPRENNMYNVDLKNIVPSGYLTCLFAKATLDESNLCSKDPQNRNVDAAFDHNENESEVHVSPSNSDKTKKHDEKAKKEAKGKSHVELSTGVRDLNDEFKEFSVSITNGVNAASI